MEVKEIISNAQDRMKMSEDALQNEFARIRAGVANASLLSGIQANYYGAPTPLQQLAGITVPEARMLVVAPYDKTALKEIVHAIEASDIGINPTVDGDRIRLVIPPLTKERREELTKTVGKYLEQGKVAVRNIRRSAIDDLKALEKDKEISEDELHRYEDQIQDLTEKSYKVLEKLASEKEDEIMNK